VCPCCARFCMMGQVKALGRLVKALRRLETKTDHEKNRTPHLTAVHKNRQTQRTQTATCTTTYRSTSGHQDPTWPQPTAQRRRRTVQPFDKKSCLRYRNSDTTGHRAPQTPTLWGGDMLARYACGFCLPNTIGATYPWLVTTYVCC
jgi:hypothetical protein